MISTENINKKSCKLLRKSSWVSTFQLFLQKGEILSTLWVKGEKRCTLCQRVFIALNCIQARTGGRSQNLGCTNKRSVEATYFASMPGKNLGVQVLAPSAPPVLPALQAFSKRYEQLKQFTKSILLHLSLTQTCPKSIFFLD